jgi:hypothetical protein
MRTLWMLAVSTSILFTLFVRTDNTSAESQGPIQHESRLDNYDIRMDRSAAAAEKLMRSGAEKLNADPAPSTASDSPFTLEYNADLKTFEVIAPKNASQDFLATTNGRTRLQTLKDFVRANRDVFGPVSASQLDKVADYENPAGNIGFAHLTQQIDGVPVFGAEVKAGFTRTGEMFRVINNLAPGVEQASVSADFASPETAIASAAEHIGVTISTNDLNPFTSSTGTKSRYSSAAFTDVIDSEKFYFPIGGGRVRAAWRVLLWTGGPAYYVVVDAADGTLLWRKNITEEQTAAATYNVYGNSTSLLKTADSPSPYTPGCFTPTPCPQPPAIARMNFTLVGNEPPYTFNNEGWIPDAGLPVRTPANPNITDGNNVEAGIDRMAPNGVDEGGWAFGIPSRFFSYPYNPAPGNPPPGDEPLPPGPQTYPPTPFQQGVITHGFYTLNRWHDEMYLLGFNEQARNFQHLNFGRGGLEGDRVSYEIQDTSGTNSGSVSVTADGARPRLVMMIFTNPTPDRDGALDGHIALHELTHALSGRLHANATGLGTNMARGLGEGWSDFYPFALMSEPDDNRFGTHALTGYVTYQLLPGYTSNYYYGIRRFPVAVYASRAPNGLPYNPLTFRYINSDCNTLIGTTSTNPNSAYPRGPIGVNTCDEAHNIGEVWAVMLWEVRDQLIQRHGAAEGNRRVLQYVTDGMKLSPVNPTMLNARDAIIAAATASDSGDVLPVWRGFAVRGMGFSASIIAPGTGSNNTIVTEAFNLPQQFRRPPRADFDGDGKSDVSVFRPSDGVWYLNRSFSGFAGVTWGIATDTPIPDDFDGDGKSDIAVYRPTADNSTADYFVLNSATSTVSYIWWGTTGDISITEDFDGDNKADPAIFRPSTGVFWALRSTNGTALAAGPLAGAVPLAGDFDGDGRGDFATFDDGRWRILQAVDNYSVLTNAALGTTGDRIVHGDYDGDGKDDIAIFRPSDNTWYIQNSTGGVRYVYFGASTDIPVPADYDGDGRTDVAVYRNGTWYMDRSTSGFGVAVFGAASDRPLPKSYIP